MDLVIAHADTLERAREAAAAAPGRPAVICVDAEIGAFRGEPAGDPLPSTPLGAQDTMYLPYSSGTTGLPKGVELSHANLVYNMLQGHSIEGAFYKEDCVTLSPLPLFHIYGFLASLHFPLVYGLPLITMKRYDIELFCALVEKHKVTRIHVVPPILLHLSKHPAVAEHDVSSLEMAISAAAPLRPALEALAKERLQCKVKQLWGMSELSPLGTGTPDDGIKDGVGSVGPPWYVSVFVVCSPPTCCRTGLFCGGKEGGNGRKCGNRAGSKQGSQLTTPNIVCMREARIRL